MHAGHVWSLHSHISFHMIELVSIISTHFLRQTFVQRTIVELFAEKSQMTGRRWSMPPLRSWRLHGRSWRQGCHESEENASEMLGQLRVSCLSCFFSGANSKAQQRKGRQGNASCGCQNVQSAQHTSLSWNLESKRFGCHALGGSAASRDAGSEQCYLPLDYAFWN